MITVSLAEIKAHTPPIKGWKMLLKTKGGARKADMDLQFPIVEVLDLYDFFNTLLVLRCRPEHDELWQEYAVWCAQQVEHLIDVEHEGAKGRAAVKAEMAAFFAVKAAKIATCKDAGSNVWIVARCAKDAARMAGWSADNTKGGAVAAAAAIVAQKSHLLKMIARTEI
jgi:hypothetical protein